MIALFIFELGYSCSKLIAVAVFGCMSGGWLVAYLACESVALLVVRIAIQNWRMYTAAGDMTWVNLVYHLVCSILMLAAPFPVLRAPFSQFP